MPRDCHRAASVLERLVSLGATVSYDRTRHLFVVSLADHHASAPRLDAAAWALASTLGIAV